jgi:hypothetical protein
MTDVPSVAAALDSFEMTGLIHQKSRVKGLNRHEDIRENSSVRNPTAPIDQTVPPDWTPIWPQSVFFP